MLAYYNRRRLLRGSGCKELPDFIGSAENILLTILILIIQVPPPRSLRSEGLIFWVRDIPVLCSILQNA